MSRSPERRRPRPEPLDDDPPEPAAAPPPAPERPRRAVRPGLLVAALVVAGSALLAAAPDGTALAGARASTADGLRALGDALTLDEVVVADGSAPTPAEQQSALSAQAAVEVDDDLDDLETALFERRYADGLTSFEQAAERLAVVLPQHGRAALQSRAEQLRERLVRESQAPLS